MKNQDPRFEGLTPTSYSETVGAGKRLVVDLVGTYYYFLECSGILFVSTSGSSPMPHATGTGLNVNFTRLEFYNPAAVDVTFTVFIGMENGYIDNRLNVISSRTPLHQMEQETEALAAPFNQIVGGGVEEFTGVFGAGYKWRKALLVTNLDSSLKIEIMDSQASCMMYVFPETSVYIPTSDHLIVHNLNGTAVSCCVGELVYKA